MPFAQMQNGIIDELVVDKIMLQLNIKAPFTKRVPESEFKKVVALVRLSEQDMKAIEKRLAETGMITRRGKTIYF